MLDLSNYTYNTYVDSYRNASRTLSAGTYLINAKTPHTDYGIIIGSNGYLLIGNGEWIKIKINSSTAVNAETFNSDDYNYYYFWKHN